MLMQVGDRGGLLGGLMISATDEAWLMISGGDVGDLMMRAANG